MISHIKSNVLNGELSNRQLCAQKLNESVNKYEDTILHYAVYHKRQELIKFLIKYGANLNKVNKRGKGNHYYIINNSNNNDGQKSITFKSSLNDAKLFDIKFY